MRELNSDAQLTLNLKHTQQWRIKKTVTQRGLTSLSLTEILNDLTRAVNIQKGLLLRQIIM